MNKIEKRIRPTVAKAGMIGPHSSKPLRHPDEILTHRKAMRKPADGSQGRFYVLPAIRRVLDR
jgi:hypothetical protein